MYYNKEFLKELDKYRHRDIYARITLLTFDEQPVEYIEGKVTGGSINIDGTSALRRTCNLTMVSASLDANIFLLNLERKFILEIGLKNKIDPSYPEIIWFKQGIFVTTGCNTARQTSSYQISLSGKDKMCLLNGDVSGIMPYSVDFGTIEEVSKDGTTVTYTKVKIKDIIRNAVEEFGNEFPYNIIINDLEESGLELLEYKGDTRIYMFRNFTQIENDQTFVNLTLDGSMQVYWAKIEYNKDGSETILQSGKKRLDAFDEKEFDVFTSLPIYTALRIKFNEQDTIYPYTVVKADQGDCIGYRQTDLVYAGDLIANVGDSLTSILDKIKTMLVDFEYYYDIDGHFIFQKKKSYEKWGYQAISENEEGKLESYFENSKIKSDPFYNFEDNTLVISFNNNPDYSNVKNDFAIWGTRKGVSGAEIPVHLRFAIDRKPKSYTTYKPDMVKIKNEKEDENTNSYLKYNDYPQYTYIAAEDGSWKIDGNIIYCDWREIIYQMAKDYHKYRDTRKDFYQQIIYNNLDENGVSRYPTGRTNYEQYYTDILGFWRDIYSPIGLKDKNKKGEYVTPPGFYKQVLLSNSVYKQNKYYTKEDVYSNIVIKYVDEDIKEEKEKNYLVNLDETDRFPIFKLDSSRSFDENKIYYELSEEITFDEENEKPFCFCDDERNNPHLLNFWFDFLDTTGDLGKYSVRALGQRPKNVNNSNVKSIYYRQTPNFIYVNPDSQEVTKKIILDSSGKEIEEKVIYDELDTKTAYTYITSTTALENCLSISTQGISAMEELQTCLNENTFCNENTTLTTVPIYYIEPNVRVAIKDKESKVNGEYLINKITLPLTYNGTMSLNVVKIVDDIY